MSAAGAAFAGDSYRTRAAERPRVTPEYSAQAPEYEVYEVYMVPAGEIVLIPIEPREGPISGDELG